MLLVLHRCGLTLHCVSEAVLEFTNVCSSIFWIILCDILNSLPMILDIGSDLKLGNHGIFDKKIVEVCSQSLKERDVRNFWHVTSEETT